MMITQDNLIQGTDFEKLKIEIDKGIKLKELIALFDSENFLMTEYKPINNMVHMIIKLNNGKVFQFENCICGYLGEGVRNAISVLELLGIDDNNIRQRFLSNDIVHLMYDDNGNLIKQKYEIEGLFYSKVRESYLAKMTTRKIKLTKDVRIDFKNRSITFINPQNENFIGFLALLKHLDINYIEYYLGTESPLENNLVISDYRKSYHVNLVLYSNDFRVVCLIEKKKEIDVIETIHYVLTNKNLFEFRRFNNIWEILKSSYRYRKYSKAQLNEVQRVLVKWKI